MVLSCIEKSDCERGFKQTMFVQPKSASAELWDGPRTGVEGVKELFGADEAYDNTRFISHLKKIISSSKNIFMDNPGTMPTLIKDDTTKKLIETGTLSLASWKNKRLVISKKGVCGDLRGKKKAFIFSFDEFCSRKPKKTNLFIPRPQITNIISIKQDCSRA